MADEIIQIIKIDLDQKSIDKGYLELEAKSSQAGKASAEGLSEPIENSLLKVAESIGKVNKRFDSLLFRVTAITSTVSASIGVFTFLEREFNLLSRAMAILGIDFDDLVLSLINVKDAIIDLVKGEGSFGSLKFAIGGVLQELGLINSPLLSAAKSMNSVSSSVDKVSRGIGQLFIKARIIANTFAIITGGLIILEKEFGVVSAILAKFNIDLDEVVKTFGKVGIAVKALISGDASFTSVKLAIGQFLQEIGVIDSALLKTIGAFTDLNEGLEAFGSNLTSVGAAAVVLSPIVANFRSISKLGKSLLGKVFGGQGFFGLISSLGAVSGSLILLGETLDDIDNRFLKAVASTSKFAGLLIGGLSAALGYAVVKLSEFASEGGAKAVAFFDKISKSAIKATGDLEVFSAFVVSFNKITSGGIGTIESYNDTIRSLSDEFNLSGGALRKSAQEIISVGAAINMSEKQMKSLMRVSAEYAKINKKDVFQTTVSIVKALNGQADSVVALGIKLNATAVRQFAYKKGLTESFEKLSENEKVQIRYNKLLSQYSTIAGIGNVAAGSLADQQERLNINVARVNEKLGSGAKLIERNNVAAAGLNFVLNNVSDGMLRVAGFSGALGSRLMQVTGIIVGLSFKVFVATKFIRILNTVLSSEIGMKAFASNLPFINKTLNQIISNAAGTGVVVKSLGSLVKGVGLSIMKQFGLISQFLFGVNIRTATFFQIFKGGLGRLRDGIKLVIPLVKMFARTFGLVIIKLLIVIGVVKLLMEAFIFIEKRTGIFTDLWNILVKSFESSKSVFEPLIAFFNRVGKVVLKVAEKAFGVLIFAIAGAISLINKLVQANPFNVFSKETVSAFALVGAKADLLKVQLSDVNFEISKLPVTAGKATNKLKDIMTVNIEDIIALMQDLKDVGKTELQILDEQFVARKTLVDAALKQGLIQRKQFEEMMTKIILDHSIKRNKIVNKSLIELNKAVSKQLQGTLVRIMSSAFQEMGKVLVGAGSGFKAFLGLILNILGDMAISIGTTVIAASQAIQALKLSLFGTGASAIVLGGALIAVGAALKVFSGKFAGSSSGAVSTGVSAGGGVSSPTGSVDFGEDDGFSSGGEIEEKGPSIQVNVRGDILDSEDTGLRIVKLINDAFDQQGAVVTGGVA